MKLIFEKSVSGRGMQYLPPCDVEEVPLPAHLIRETAPALPEMSETDISRHYTELNKNVHGVNCGFYPLGSCLKCSDIAGAAAWTLSYHWLLISTVMTHQSVSIVLTEGHITMGTDYNLPTGSAGYKACNSTTV